MTLKHAGQVSFTDGGASGTAYVEVYQKDKDTLVVLSENLTGRSPTNGYHAFVQAVVDQLGKKLHIPFSSLSVIHVQRTVDTDEPLPEGFRPSIVTNELPLRVSQNKVEVVGGWDEWRHPNQEDIETRTGAPLMDYLLRAREAKKASTS
jgi:hypothetical protein